MYLVAASSDQKTEIFMAVPKPLGILQWYDFSLLTINRFLNHRLSFQASFWISKLLFLCHGIKQVDILWLSFLFLQRISNYFLADKSDNKEITFYALIFHMIL